MNMNNCHKCIRAVGKFTGTLTRRRNWCYRHTKKLPNTNFRPDRNITNAFRSNIFQMHRNLRIQYSWLLWYSSSPSNEMASMKGMCASRAEPNEIITASICEFICILNGNRSRKIVAFGIHFVDIVAVFVQSSVDCIDT